MKHFVVAITRTCGSGGTSIARKLAEEYDIPIYERKLLRLASEDSGISEKLFAAVDEDERQSTLYKAYKKVYRGEIIPPESEDFTRNDNLFNYQAKVLKELTRKESYIIIGRAADVVLKDYPYLVRVFVHASEQYCMENEMEHMGYDKKQAKQTIKRINAYRSAYYKYHTGKEWMNVENYDLSVDTGMYTYDEGAEMIQRMIDFKLSR